jgi:hypothetical protein
VLALKLIRILVAIVHVCVAICPVAVKFALVFGQILHIIIINLVLLGAIFRGDFSNLL